MSHQTLFALAIACIKPPSNLIAKMLETKLASACESTSQRATGLEIAPDNVADVLTAVREAAAKSQVISPTGGMTAFDFGGLRAEEGARLSSLKLNRVIDYPAEDMTITVEAGLRLADLQQILGKHNQYLPVDPPQSSVATVGGVVASGWTGPRRHHTMRPRDQLIGIAFVTGHATLARGGGRVVKNVAGYDFPKLVTGSLGSLGMITELTFKVRPKPESTAIAIIQVNTAQELDTYLSQLNTSATRPTAIEVLCQKAAEPLRNRLGLATSRFTVALFFDESAKAVDWQLERVATEAPAGAVISLLQNEDALQEQNNLTERLAGEGAILAARVAVAPSMLPALLENSWTDWNIQAHAGQGIATFIHDSGVGLTEAAQNLSQLRQATAKLGGTVILSICPNQWKQRLGVWGPKRPDWDLMIGIKRALDPKSIFNPGLLPGS